MSAIASGSIFPINAANKASMIGITYAIKKPVQRVIQHIFARARAQGKPSGILAPAEADASRYLEWSARFVAGGSDLGVFRSATQFLCDKIQRLNAKR